MSKNKNQEVVEAQTTAVATANLSDWGAPVIDARDVVIPKILLMQGISELVADGKAQIGDYVDSLTGVNLGSINKPLSFIPFHMEKLWVISGRKAGDTNAKFEFDKYEPVNSSNMQKPFNEIIGETEYKNEYTLQFYCLLPNDTSMPYVLSFKSTSSRAGKVLSTQMYVRNPAAGLTPPAYTMELGGHKDKNDKGTYMVMDVKPVGKTSDALIAECLNWYKIIQAGKTKVAPEPSTHGGSFAEENTKF